MDFFSLALGFLAGRMLRSRRVEESPPPWVTPPGWIELCPHCSFDPSGGGYVGCCICNKSWHSPDYVPPDVRRTTP